MTYSVNHLMGNSDLEYPLDSLSDLHSELSKADNEHTNVSLTHESEWCLSVFASGLVIWENVSGDGEPKHMRDVTKEKAIELWCLLASGLISEIDKENWLLGYGS